MRDYGTAKWEGGDAGCDHIAPATKPRAERPNPSGCGLGKGGPTWEAQEHASRVYKDTCKKCGAHRVDDQIGLEQTPDEYVAKLVQVFREVRRVLKDDGTLWLNLGDSFNSSPSNQQNGAVDGPAKDMAFRAQGRRKREIPGLKPKDLIGIPWMVAFALRADGWYLRSDIIWAKPNPMPESVKDRPTKAHEYVFLLTKSAKYYYDNEAVYEVATGYDGRKDTKYKGGDKDMSCGEHERWPKRMPPIDSEGLPARNKRTVWTINTQPFKGAHFAVMPEKLVEPCVLAGSKPGDVVLDPFAGSGTVGVVAQKNGRQFIGIELNPDYVKLAEMRLLTTPQSLFNQSYRRPHE